MSTFLILAGLQGLTIGVDEIFFHHKRGLPRWERIGHPIDTATVLACLLFIGLSPHTHTNEVIYYMLAILSCLCVTKDEWIHRKFCTGEEMWLHSILFILHPLLLFSALREWDTHQEYFLFAAGGIFSFFVYQIIYWNFIEYRLQARKRSAVYQQQHASDEMYEYFGE